MQTGIQERVNELEFVDHDELTNRAGQRLRRLQYVTMTLIAAGAGALTYGLGKDERYFETCVVILCAAACVFFLSEDMYVDDVEAYARALAQHDEDTYRS